MSQLDDAIKRYNNLIESGPFRDPVWVEALHKRMEESRLTNSGRPITPFLRPNFITRRQHDALIKTGEALICAIDRMQSLALATPALLARMELLPAEKMLASVDPGYNIPEIVSRLDSHLHNGSLNVVQYNADSPTGLAYAEALSDIFYDAPPVKEFRKKYALTKLAGRKHLLTALLKAYKEFGGKKKPNIAIVEFRQPYAGPGQSEYDLVRDYFREEGHNVEIVSPDHLEYRGGSLRSRNFEIQLVYRRISVQEFLLRFDLTHPLVRAYRDRAVCVVNSFRAELAHKRAMFALLTDDALTAKFPAAERKAIREHVPWTRLAKPGKTTRGEETIEFPEYIQQNRQDLVLKPNDEHGDLHTYFGWEMDETAWERALKQATRAPYVVQARVAPSKAAFPLVTYGQLEFREMQVDVHPHAYLGRILGCSSWVSTGGSAFSTATGPVPTYVIEPKSS
jgi:hypothetical protein